MNDNLTKTLKCIICKKNYNEKLITKPFCSKRCSYIDLNNWFAEEYFIHLHEDGYKKDN